MNLAPKAPSNMSIRAPLIALALTFAAPAAAQTPVGVWEGALTRGDAATPVRLTITEADGQPQATFDLPELVYAEEPVAIAQREDGATVVTLPFGLGDFALQRTGAHLAAAREPFAITLSSGATAPYTHEPVQIPIAGGAYAGELYTPTDLRRPRGAIVIAGGASASGERVTWGVRSWCDFFARQGMHCLVYPRRPNVVDGVASTMSQDAADLRSAVAFLAVRPGVDRARLGVFGGSRGTWLATSTAARDEAIRFLILSAAPATTPSDQEISSVVHRLRAAGQSEDAIADAVAYLRLYFSVARTGQGWDTLAAAVRRAEAAPWGEFVDQPRTLADLAWYHANGEFDATQAYRALRIPVFAYWGGNDDVVPPAFHRALLESLMTENTALTTRVFPGGDHRGEQVVGFDDQRVWHWFGMAPGLLDGISTWLRQRCLAIPHVIAVRPPSMAIAARRRIPHGKCWRFL